jgi:hypothetical protein
MTRNLIVLMVLLLSIGTYCSADISAGLVAHWTFDDGNGITAEDSAGSNDGTLVNGPVWTTGSIGGALDFNGDDGVYIKGSAGTGSNLNIYNTDVTLSAWVNIRTGGTIVARSKPHYITYQLQAYTWARANMYISPVHYAVDTAKILSPNTWYHIVGVFDRAANKGYVYVNGVLEAEGPLPDAQSTNDGLTKVGCRNDATDQPFDGKIDDVRIYNRALSVDEVALLYAIEQPNLVGLEISGPDGVVENSEQQYKAIASYDDGSEKDITDKCEWFADDCGFAGIEPNGLFYSDMALYLNQTCNIYAEYQTDANEVLTAEKEIAILPMCPAGSALTFDGVDDYVKVLASNELSPQIQNGQMTVSLWVNLDAGSSGPVLAKGSSWTAWEYGIFVGSSVGITLWQKGGSNYAVASGGVLTPGQWHNVTGTYKIGSFLKIYLDGTLVGQTTALSVNPPLTQGTGGLCFGKEDHSSHPWNISAGIDNVSIWNYAKTDAEVQQLFNMQITGNEVGLVGYWDFEEGQGQIANDKSGNGNDGQLGGSGEVQISDPNWVSPGAPVICTKQALAKRNIGLAIDIKKDIVEDLDYALKAELAANTMLLEVQRDKQFKNVWPSANIVRARMQTFLAIVQERIARSKIVVSINHLANAIEYLNAPAEETTVKPGKPKK